MKLKCSRPTFHPQKKTASSFIGIQAVHHEKSILEAREATKLHYCDSTSSSDEFSSYAHSIKFISTSPTTRPVNNETLDLYSEGATLSKFIHERRPTTTKPTFVALPHLTSHSTFYECSRGILCQPQHSHHSPLTKLGVIIPYSIHLEREITSPLTSIISPYVFFEPSDEPSDETIRRLYGNPSKEKRIIDHGSQDRQEASISSQLVEHCPRYTHQGVT